MEELTIDIEKIKNVDDGSISDPETIRQIAYHGIYISKDENFYNKINPKFTHCGLYPHMHYFGKVPEKYIKDE